MLGTWGSSQERQLGFRFSQPDLRVRFSTLRYRFDDPELDGRRRIAFDRYGVITDERMAAFGTFRRARHNERPGVNGPASTSTAGDRRTDHVPHDEIRLWTAEGYAAFLWQTARQHRLVAIYPKGAVGGDAAATAETEN